MTPTTPHSRVTSLLRAGLLASLAFPLGCEESIQDPTDDVVGGGETYVLDAELYAQLVAPVITAKGCDAAGQCHGAGIRGTFQLSPQENKDEQYDFQQAVLQVNGYDPTKSPLLTEPLDETSGGSVHPEAAFVDENDDDYQAILSWIEAGEFQ